MRLLISKLIGGHALISTAVLADENINKARSIEVERKVSKLRRMPFPSHLRHYGVE